MMYVLKNNLGWVNLTRFCFVDMDCFAMFNMIIAAPPQLKMLHDNLDRDHRGTLNKYVGSLKELINMNCWPELVEVLTVCCDI